MKIKTDTELLTEWGTLAQDHKEISRQIDALAEKLAFVNKAKADVVVELSRRGYKVEFRK